MGQWRDVGAAPTPRYIAGESDAAETVTIEEHLASCKQCAAEVEADQRVDACLRKAMLEDEPDTSAVIRHVVARMEHVPWWQRYFSVGMLRFAAVGALDSNGKPTNDQDRLIQIQIP